MNKILIVDDEPHIVKLLERFLSLKGFEAQGAGDGAKALEIIKSAADINLIIIDMKMPGVSGINVLKEMKAMDKDIPVVILSGCPVAEGGDYDDLKGMGYNPDEVLCKPMDLFALLDIINRKITKEN